MNARSAGSRWRLLVHDIAGKRTAHHIQSHPDNLPRTSSKGLRERVLALRAKYEAEGLETTQVLAGTEFDELVVGRWLHVEQQTDRGTWWMDVGGVVLWVRADYRGRPRRVTVYGPGEYNDPVEGCTYDGAVAVPDDAKEAL